MLEISMFTGPNCKYCKLAKEYLNSRNIPFKEFDISTDPEAKAKVVSMGFRGIPVTLINGSSALIGFTEAAFEEKLAHLGKVPTP